MDFLFGHLYTGSVPTFSHDQKMLRTRSPSKPTFVSTSRPSTAGSATSDAQDSPEVVRKERSVPGGNSWVSRRGDHYVPRTSDHSKRKRSSGTSSHDDELHKTLQSTSVLLESDPAAPMCTNNGPTDDAAVEALRKGAAAFEAKSSSFDVMASTTPSSRRDKFRERIASTIPIDTEAERAKRQRTVPMSPFYGRLSPPASKKQSSFPTFATSREPSTDLADVIEQRRRRMTRTESERSSVDRTRAALREEAYTAALGGLQWSDVGLVSTNSGHSAREEEL